jgi:hypothetical protein
VTALVLGASAYLSMSCAIANRAGNEVTPLAVRQPIKRRLSRKASDSRVLAEFFVLDPSSPDAQSFASSYLFSVSLPIPEFLAKKRAEQARGTALAYEVTFGVFLRFCDERGIHTLGQLSEPVAHAFIDAERARGMAEGTLHDRVRRLKTWTRECASGAGQNGIAGRM